MELLQDLVRTPSVGGTRAESEQERLARDFAASGLETDLWPLPLAELERAPDFSSKSLARAVWPRRSSTKPGAGGPTLMLNEHVDRDGCGRCAVRGPKHGAFATRLHGRSL